MRTEPSVTGAGHHVCPGEGSFYRKRVVTRGFSPRLFAEMGVFCFYPPKSYNYYKEGIMKYDFSAIEKKWQDKWEEAGIFHVSAGNWSFTSCGVIDT